jgi:hypothetical protein
MNVRFGKMEETCLLAGRRLEEKEINIWLHQYKKKNVWWI